MPSPDKLDAALVNAQAAFGKIEKTRTAKVVSPKARYEYKYADLADILNVVTEPLNKNGLFLTQRTRIEWGTDGHANTIIVTELRHESGEVLSSEWPLALQQMPQQTGILLTYYRRYALCALLGIQAEEMSEQQEGEGNGSTHGDKPVTRGKPHSGRIHTSSGKTKTEIHAWLADFVREIHACSDADQLDQLVQNHEEMIIACQTDMSSWWYGDIRNPDYEPVAGRLARVRAELVQAAEEKDPEIPS